MTDAGVVHRADVASCEAAAMRLRRCAERARLAGLAEFADGLHDLASSLRDYGAQISALAARERDLHEERGALEASAGAVDLVVPLQPAASDWESRVHRLRSETGRAAAVLRRRSDAIHDRLRELANQPVSAATCASSLASYHDSSASTSSAGPSAT